MSSGPVVGVPVKAFFTTVKEVLRPRQDAVSAVRGAESLWEVGTLNRNGFTGEAE